jgi:ABC-type transport system involved in cytochrome bd biosynthesis fused ATPase/permease subunit
MYNSSMTTRSRSRIAPLVDRANRDLILVINNGRIEEAGTHADLIKQAGLYAEPYGLQASAYR